MEVGGERLIPSLSWAKVCVGVMLMYNNLSGFITFLLWLINGKLSLNRCHTENWKYELILRTNWYQWLLFKESLYWNSRQCWQNALDCADGKQVKNKENHKHTIRYKRQFCKDGQVLYQLHCLYQTWSLPLPLSSLSTSETVFIMSETGCHFIWFTQVNLIFFIEFIIN